MLHGMKSPSMPVILKGIMGNERQDLIPNTEIPIDSNPITAWIHIKGRVNHQASCHVNTKLSERQ